jgi:hypothetical protein
MSARVHPDIRGVWSLTGDGDVWGDVISWCFDVAEVLTVAGEYVPASWEFRPSPLLNEDNVRESWPESELLDMYDDGSITGDDLRESGEVFIRYSHILTAMGRDY